MNRLQKKCVIAATGFHLLLFCILIVGPAFLSRSDEEKIPDDLQIINFVPVKTTDENVTGGGNPNASVPKGEPNPPVQARPQPQPRPTPQPPTPAPEPVRPKVVEHHEPAPAPAPKSVVKEAKEDKPERAEPKPEPHKIHISTRTVNLHSESRSTERQASEARAQELADARRQAERQIGNAISGIREGLSGSTTIELRGPGGGGVPYANFLQAVKSVYANAWIVPDGVTDDSATATASVTIARDGSVISARIVKSSGNSLVDRSVRETLDRVKYAAPLPDGAAESQRTVTINFNVKAKQLLG